MTLLKKMQAGVLMVALFAVTACDKDRPLDTVDNKQDGLGLIKKTVVADHMSQDRNLVVDNETGQAFTLAQSDKIPTKNQYLAVVSTTSIDKDAPVIPYEMGREVRTILSFTKDNLIAYEVPNQFARTDLNFKPFIKIPIEHTDFKCAVDANQKCTQVEVEDTEKTWVDKAYFKPDFKELELLSPDGMFSSFLNYAISCSEQLDSKLISYSIEADAINITIEKTMQQSFLCAGFTAIINPSEVTYRIQQNISMVKLDTLSSPEYEAMPYNQVGANEFGYFRTIFQERDSANRVCSTCQKEFVSRWNPNKKVIDFYLSEGFAKPENTTLRDATYHGIDVVNQAFKEAGTDMQIKLHDGDGKLTEGDLRKNLIVLVEDPIKRGLLGYGPSITNPMTGEIVHARTVMFSGIMRMTIERAYDEFLELVTRQQLEENQPSIVEGSEGGSEGSGVDLGQASLLSRAMGYQKAPQVMSLDAHSSHIESKNILKNKGISLPSPGGIVGDDSQVKLLERHFDIHGVEHIELGDEIEELSKRNYYPVNLFDTHSAMGGLLKKIILETQFQPWDNLTPAVQENVINRLLPVVWVPTLVHEIGHNLGLRHNFSGSNDKDNFYTKEELAEKGIEREMKYSSIMDYSFSSANELSIMGKYDVAALRFAYAEKLEALDGSLVSIHAEEIDPVKLKSFEFCTDESVSLNANCNRFDEGTNYTEIITNMIQGYERDYLSRNFKRNRFNFSSSTGDVDYAFRMKGTLGTMRLVFELYELIVKDNAAVIEANPDIWETNEFLKDIREATIISGNFLINIIRTPDVHCLVGLKETGAPVTIVPLRRFSTNDSTCNFAEGNLPDAYFMMGQAGKSFNHIRDRRNPQTFVDEIDVRGIWIDKMLAIETLLSRSTGTGIFDNKPFNYLMVPELRQPILETLTAITTDKFTDTMVFQMNQGGAQAVQWNHSLYGDSSHTLDFHYHPYVRWMFGLERGPTQFHGLAIKTIKGSAENSFDREIGQFVSDYFDVHFWLPNGQDPKDLESYSLGTNKIYAFESNVIARGVISKVSQVKNAEALQELLVPGEDVEDPEAWVAEQNQKIETIRDLKLENPEVEAPADSEPIVKLAYSIDAETLTDTLTGGLLPIGGFYEMILEAMK